ncbi:LPS export ABC transporter permease LptG [soil metagenome]
MMRNRLSALESYVLSQTLINVAGAAAIIGSVVLLIDFVELSRDVAARFDVSFMRIAGLTLLRSPSVLVVLMPFMFLFGTLAAFVGLNRRSELVAMRAAGVSAWRFIMPAAAAAFTIGLFTVTALSPMTAALQARYDHSRALLENPSGAENKEVWLRDGDGRSQIVIQARALDRDHGELRLKNASFYIYTLNHEGVAEFSRRLEATEARLKMHEWLLSGVREAAPNAGSVSYDTLPIPSNKDPSKEVEHFASPNAISFWDLPSAIKTTEQAGYTAAGYRLRQQQLLATPVLFAAMSILGAAFSLRLMRLGGLAVLATSGVALGFVFFFLNELSGAMGKADLAPIFAAAWAPPVLALLSGLTLILYTEDG